MEIAETVFVQYLHVCTHCSLICNSCQLMVQTLISEFEKRGKLFLFFEYLEGNSLCNLLQITHFKNRVCAFLPVSCSLQTILKTTSPLHCGFEHLNITENHALSILVLHFMITNINWAFNKASSLTYHFSFKSAFFLQ